jgi:hypothetical protein
MKIVRALALLVLGVTLSACATADAVSRNAQVQSVPQARTQLISVPTPPEALSGARVASPVRIENVIVNVSQRLLVSEANSYLPSADIVWRGEPSGDRHAQVKDIFETAMITGAQTLDGERPVDLLINVRRFHALTEKARYTVGGVHSMVFDLALADPVTGDLIEPWREVRADLKAFGGQQAVDAEARGETQKVRITAFLAEVLREEISKPEGYTNANLGLIQILNQI